MLHNPPTLLPSLSEWLNWVKTAEGEVSPGNITSLSDLLLQCPMLTYYGAIDSGGPQYFSKISTLPNT